MADRKTTVDVSSVLAGLSAMSGEMMDSLARSMAVAGGQVIRDEAIARAPVGTEAGGSITPGLLRSAIYLAHSDNRSREAVQVYSVSWNSKKAPHGHLLEFGHWQTHGWQGRALASPKWVAAHPFIRPAFEATRQRSLDAMIARGKERLPELLAEAKS